MVVHSTQVRVKKYLGRRFHRLLTSIKRTVRDPRDVRGRRRSLGSLLDALMVGMVAGDRTLRDVEERTESVVILDGDRVAGRIPDTTLGDLVEKLNVDEFEGPLVQQVREMIRRDELKPMGLPCGVATVDGKDLGKLSHDANGQALRQSESGGEPFWHVRVLRSVLSSAAGIPCLGQLTIPGREGEITNFPQFANWLHETYGRHGLFEIFDVDAGFLSREVFSYISRKLQYGLVAGLKGNQPNLFAEANRVLGRLARKEEPEAVSPWEPYKGKLIRRKLYRTAELASLDGWDDLRQVWLVVQETAHPPKHADRRRRGHLLPSDDWSIEVEWRFFATNLLWNRLSAEQILLLVRNHWAVENDCFHSLDVQWGEDRPAWCGRGNAVMVLGMLRVLAYNLVQTLRKRHLLKVRPQKQDTMPWPWRPLFEHIREVLKDIMYKAAGQSLGPPNVELLSQVAAA